MKADVKKLRGFSTALCLVSGAALAQSAGPAPVQPAETAQLAASAAPADSAAAPEQGNRKPDPAAEQGLQSVVVTATRRATSLQKVTGTIDVADGAKLEALNVKDVSGIETLVPGVSMSRTAGNMPFIRGIGTFSAGFNESSVGVYIDGIYLPNTSAALFSFNNIDRVEVLKGPQGTLYGRNTTGGLINVITRAPEASAAADASLGYSSFDTFTQNFYGSVPLSDTVSANIALYHQKQGKGWSTNVVNGADVQKSTDTGVYGKVQWKPGLNTKVTGSALYSKSDSDIGWAYTIAPNSFGPDGTPYQGEYKVSLPIAPSNHYEGSMGSVKVEHSFDAVDFFSLSGYQYGRQASSLVQNGIVGQPVAGRSAAYLQTAFNNHTISQEFQLSSKNPAARYDWVAGAYFYRDETAVRTSNLTSCVGTVCAPLPGNLPPTNTDVLSTTTSSSVYADGTYKVLDSTRLTLGLRYTQERKAFEGTVTARPGLPNSAASLPASVVQSTAAAGLAPYTDFPKLTYRAVLAHDFSKNVQGYISNNLGFKSGTYNLNSVTNKPVRPEILDSTEIGLKSELFDRRLRVNLSAFRYSFTDIQVRSIAGLPAGSPSVGTNVASARTNGVDAQIEYRPFRGLSLNAGLGYLDAKYLEYPGVTCTAARQPGGAFLGGVINTTCNLAGSPLPMSPKYSAVLGAMYTFSTDVGTFMLVANDSYKSRYTFSPDYSVTQAPAHIIDASVRWTAPNQHYDVQFSVKNATDKYRYIAGQASTAYVYIPGAPRTFGVSLGFHL